jgi:hypothetical protein
VALAGASEGAAIAAPCSANTTVSTANLAKAGILKYDIVIISIYGQGIASQLLRNHEASLGGDINPERPLGEPQRARHFHK